MSAPEMKPKKAPAPLPHSGLGLVCALFLLSWLLHGLGILSLSLWSPGLKQELAKKLSPSSPVSLKIHTPDAQATQLKALVEAVQEKTAEKPDPAKVRAGQVDHHTLKETQPAYRPDRRKALHPGQVQQRLPQPQRATSPTASAPQASELAANPRQAQTSSASSQPGLAILSSPKITARDRALLPQRQQARNRYEQLLNQSIATMGSEVEQGYQDYLNEDIELGKTIDLNTQEYRYIGYFTNLRKAIELTWNYPSSALHRGLDGNVFLRFTITADGKVSHILVLNSSGHYVLDHAVVDAIQLAAPFAPLPEGFGKKIDIKGTFRYILN